MQFNIPNNDKPVDTNRHLQITPEKVVENDINSVKNLTSSQNIENIVNSEISNITSGLINYGVNQVKQQILTRKFSSNFSSQEYLDAEKARKEGQEVTSELGLPVWDQITLQYTWPTNDTGPNAGLTKEYKINIALIEVSQIRNIIKTAVAGLDGTVKEYISDGDYNINIKVQLVGDAPDMYPSDSVIALKELFSVKDKIKIFNTILNKYFKINEVVVERFNFGQAEQGMRNVQSLDINCISDKADNYYIFVSN